MINLSVWLVFLSEFQICFQYLLSLPLFNFFLKKILIQQPTKTPITYQQTTSRFLKRAQKNILQVKAIAQ